MEYIEIAIVVICYLTAEMFKILFKEKMKAYRLIPILVGFLGGLIGVIVYCINPEIIDAKNVLEATLIGIVSGLASTGSNQIIKQIFNEKEEK